MSKSISKRATTAPAGLPAAGPDRRHRRSRPEGRRHRRAGPSRRGRIHRLLRDLTGQNTRQIKAIADAIEEALRRDHVKPAHVEGYGHAEWVLLDYLHLHRARLRQGNARRSTGSNACGGARRVDASVVQRRSTADAPARAVAEAARPCWRTPPARAGACVTKLSLSLARRARGGLAAMLRSTGGSAVCGRIADHPTRGAVCEPCWTAIRFITPPVLRVLRRALAFRPHADLAWTRDNARHLSRPRCHRCARIGRLSIRPARSAPTKARCEDLVHALKYEGRRSVAPRLAALLRERCRDRARRCRRRGPVPLHRRRGGAAASTRPTRSRELGRPVWRSLRRTRHRSADRRWPPRRAARTSRGRSRCGASRGTPLATHLPARRLRRARGRREHDRRDAGRVRGRVEGGGVAEVRALTVARAVLGLGAAAGAMPRPRKMVGPRVT